MKKVTVSKSLIAGKGLFAAETIRPGEEITEYCGDYLSDEEFSEQEARGNWHYAASLPKGVIDASDSKWDGCPGKFSNDASGLIRIPGLRNNSTLRWSGRPGKYKLHLVATRHIKKGDEIFTSYGRNYWNHVKNERAGTE